MKRVPRLTIIVFPVFVTLLTKLDSAYKHFTYNNIMHPRCVLIEQEVRVSINEFFTFQLTNVIPENIMFVSRDITVLANLCTKIKKGNVFNC